MKRNPSRAAPDRQRTERAALLSLRAFIDDMRTRYRELERETGASIAMHRALACVAASPGVSASGLATALGMKRPAVSHLLKGLSGRGWIERRRISTDQRSVQLFLTSTGKRIIDATGGRAVGVLQRAVSKLSDVEVDSLSSGLVALLQELPAPPRPRAHRTKETQEAASSSGCAATALPPGTTSVRALPAGGRNATPGRKSSTVRS